MTEKYENKIMELELDLVECSARKKSNLIGTGISYLTLGAGITAVFYPEVFQIKEALFPIAKILGMGVGIAGGGMSSVFTTSFYLNTLSYENAIKGKIELYKKFASRPLEGEYIAAQDSTVEFNTAGLEGKLLPLNRKVNR